MSQNSPLEVHNRVTTRELKLVWNDGSVSRFAHRHLRERCRCNECTVAHLLRRDTGVVADDVVLREVFPVGHYGLRFVFSDGHFRGIYPWTYLRALMPTGNAPGVPQ